jgi:hypothetical protein
MVEESFASWHCSPVWQRTGHFTHAARRQQALQARSVMSDLQALLCKNYHHADFIVFNQKEGTALHMVILATGIFYQIQISRAIWIASAI